MSSTVTHSHNAKDVAPAEGALVFEYNTETLYIYARGKWSPILAATRSANGVSVPLAKQPNFIPFKRPFPSNKYTLIPMVYNATGSQGLTIIEQRADGFIINPIEAGLCNYIAAMEL